jgi:ribonuclease HI
VAEYAGVPRVLKFLTSRLQGQVAIHGDSNLVSSKLNGKRRFRKGLYRSIAQEAKDLLAHLRGLGWQINVRWIPHEQDEQRTKTGNHGAPVPLQSGPGVESNPG